MPSQGAEQATSSLPGIEAQPGLAGTSWVGGRPLCRRDGGIPTWLTPKAPNELTQTGGAPGCRVLAQGLSSPLLPIPPQFCILKGWPWQEGSGEGQASSPSQLDSRRAATPYQTGNSEGASLSLIPRAPVGSGAGLLVPLAPRHLAPALVLPVLQA